MLEDTFGLPELLRALRNDLIRSQENMRGETGLLKIDEVEVEVAFTATREKAGDVGLQLKILGFGLGGGGKLSKSDATVHRLTLKLKPSKSGEEADWIVAGLLPEETMREADLEDWLIERGYSEHRPETG